MQRYRERSRHARPIFFFFYMLIGAVGVGGCKLPVLRSTRASQRSSAHQWTR